MELWLERVIENAREENEILRKMGIVDVVRAREALLKDIERAWSEAQEETVTIDVAAKLCAVHPETIRRAIRDGRIQDVRENPAPGSPIRVRRKDLQILRGLSRKKKVPLDCVSRRSASYPSAKNPDPIDDALEKIIGRSP